MKTGLKKVLTRVTAAAVTCATLLATPVFATAGYAKDNTTTEYKIDHSRESVSRFRSLKKGKPHYYYSQDYYNAAVKQMITTVLAPSVAFLKKHEDEFGYHYESDEARLKDAALAYALVSVREQPYIDSSPSGHYFVCHGFSLLLERYANNLWVESSPVAEVGGEGNDRHDWNNIKIDGRLYDIEPQSGIIYIDDDTKPRTYSRHNNPVYSNRGALLNYYVEYGDGSDFFRLDPLLVLQAQHPELFKNRGITREMLVDNPEIIEWESAWEGYKYRNTYMHGYPYRIEKLIW